MPRPVVDAHLTVPRRPRSDPDAPHLDRSIIVGAALELMDRDGFDRFSLRALAKHLGAGNMSLYWYIEDRETLLTLVLDEVIGAVRLEDLEDDPLAALEQLAGRFVDAFKSHPNTVPLFALTPIVRVGPSALAVFDHAIGLLIAAGLPDDEVAAATIALFEYLAGHLVGHLTDVRHPNDAAGTALEEFLAALPDDAMPNFRSVETAFAPSLEGFDPEYGIHLLVSSLRARVGTADRPAEGT